MKRLLSMLLVLCIALSMVPVTVSAASTKISVIAAQYGMGTADWWKDFEKRFEAKNKNVDLVVDVVSWNDIYTVVNMRIANGEVPDILNIDGFMEYQAEGLLLPVDKYMSSKTYSKFPESFLQQSEADGKIWAVPDLASTRALYYNKDLLNSVGAKVPTTWEEVMKVCAALRAEYGNLIIPWGADMSVDDGISSIANYLWSNGGGFLNAANDWRLNSDANVEAIEYAMELYEKGYTNPVEATRYDLEYFFAKGRVAMTIAPEGFRGALDDINYGISTIPSADGSVTGSTGVMDRIMVFDNNQNKTEMKAITAFFDAFYEDKNYTSWTSMEGFLPATITGCEYLAKKDPSMAVWADALRSCQFLPAGKAGWKDVRNGMIDVLQQALEGGNVRDMLDALNDKVGGSEFALGTPTVKASNVASTGKVKLTWNKVDGAAKYRVYRATSKNGTYKLMKTTTGTSYTNTTAKAGVQYYYYVVALTKGGEESEHSKIVSRTCDLAQPVVKVSNVASSGKIKVSWNKIDGASKYQVYRATSKNGTYKLVKTTTGTSYTNTAVEAGKTYYYKVMAVHSKSAANSAYSEIKSRTCDLAQPRLKIGLSSGKPKVSWEKVTGAVSYKVYRATSKSGTYSLLKTTTSRNYKDTKAKAGRTYYYKVVAVCKNTGGNSAYSGIVSIKSK